MKASPELEEIARICGDEITESLYLTLTEEGLVELHHCILAALQQVVSVQAQQVSGIKEADVNAGDVTRQKALKEVGPEPDMLPHQILAWLGYWRSHIPPAATTQLQDILAVPKEETDITRFREALKSIAANRCCDKCQEAARVAMKALAQ